MASDRLAPLDFDQVFFTTGEKDRSEDHAQLSKLPDVEASDTSSLRFALYGASPMPEAVIRRAFKALPHTGFMQAYGQSEAAPCMTFLPPAEHATEGANAVHLKSAGRAARGCEIRIHDENDDEAPRGVVGQICGRGDNVMLGY
jgi:long-chain acyl-CoA synthetase